MLVRSIVPRSIIPSDLFEELDRMAERMERLFFGRPVARSEAEPRVWVPRAEVHQTDDSLIISFELPGVPKDAVEVEATEEALTVRGERKQPEEPCPEGGVCASEFVYGPFERTVAWPLPVKYEEAKAQMVDGILRVTVPLAEEAKAPEARKVEIE